MKVHQQAQQAVENGDFLRKRIAVWGSQTNSDFYWWQDFCQWKQEYEDKYGSLSNMSVVHEDK